jgi:hypothetical protein
MPPIPSPSTQHRSGYVEIVGCAGGRIQWKGFNFGAPLNAMDLGPSWYTEIVGMGGLD